MTAATTSSIIPVCTLPQLALLIDAENIAGDYAPRIVERTLARYGNPIIRRAYGDWTSDCDFTALAGRLRERGKRVYGFGMQQTMRAFVAACDEFVFLDGAG